MRLRYRFIATAILALTIVAGRSFAAEPEKPVVLTPEGMLKEKKADEKYLYTKYAGKLVEVTGIVNGKYETKEKNVAGGLALAADPTGSSLAITTNCYVGSKEDYEKVRPGEKVTLRTKVPEKDDGKALVWELVKLPKK